MSQSLESIVRRAYGEALLLAKEKGMSGPVAGQAAMKAAAKIATKITGQTVSIETVDAILHDED